MSHQILCGWEKIISCVSDQPNQYFSMDELFISYAGKMYLRPCFAGFYDIVTAEIHH